MLLVAWALGVAISGTRSAASRRWCATREVLAEVDRVLPASAERVLQAFNDVVGTSFFPRYLEPFAPERIVDGARPAPGGCSPTPTSRAARTASLKVRGTNDCGRGVEGSGFVYAHDRVMTNAHVVAGVQRPGGRSSATASVPAKVVYYNPDIDVAVLAVDTGAAAALALRPAAARPRDGVAILGYPQDGPYDVRAGPDPRRAAAALAQHLRRRHRDPRGVLAARAGPARQLRRPDRRLRRRRRRRRVRGVGHRPARPATR